MFQREKGPTAQTPVVPPTPGQQDLDNPNTHRQDAGMTSQASSAVTKAPSAESLEQTSTQNPGVLRGLIQMVNPFKSTSQVHKAASSDSLEQGRVSEPVQNPGMLIGVIQKVNPFKSTSQVPKSESQPEENTDKELQDKQTPGMMAGMIQKVNLFKSSQPKDIRLLDSDPSSSRGSLADNNNLPEKQPPGMFKGMLQKVNPFKSSTQTDACQTDSTATPLRTQGLDDVYSDDSSGSEDLDDSTIKRGSVWYTDVDTSCEAQPRKRRNGTFIMKQILPGALLGSETKEVVEVQKLQMAEVPVPSEGTVLDPLNDEEGLLEWWGTVEGWDEWNETNQKDGAEEVVEEAADRVFMAARLFVRLFNQRGASLQQRILELLALADSADNFHKKTVTASVGGGVASVAGSVTTITGLILAPFTAGTSLIVTAVGIGIATAGGVTSASANITDTVHSKTDRNKVEKMIQDYQEEIKDIRECLEFLQEGMETLEEWDFEKYAESISKRHLNQNVKHVMKEGGRAGKALMVNTESLISTVQVLGDAAKAAQVMSVTTGVMSGLFLALDVFFLAKDSMELKKGAKTEFATKIREVCKELQEGLLELNRIKEELQKTMDGIEVEEEEEEEDEELLKSDLKKLE